MNEQYILLLWLLFPLAALVVISSLKYSSVQLIKKTAVFIGFFPILLGAYTIGAYAKDEKFSQLFLSVNWFSNYLVIEDVTVSGIFTFDIGLNGISFVFLLLTSILSFVSIIAALKIKTKIKAFYQLLFLLQFGMYGVFISYNVLLFFVFLELTLLPMFFLILGWGYKDRKKSAYYYLIYNGLGSLFLLVPFVLLISSTGSGNYDVLFAANIEQQINNSYSLWLLSFILIGFAFKLPIVPFHFWMVKVHKEAPIPVVMLHAGVLLKIAAYGMIVFGMYIFPNQFRDVAFVIMIAGLINLLYGALIALRKTNIKSILAYSSISHMGIVLLGISSLQIEGLQGAVFQALSHGLIAAILFYLVMILEERYDELNIMKLGGIAIQLPHLSGVFLFAGMASLGLPALSGFISEVQVFIGLSKQSLSATIVGLLGVVLTATYVVRFVLKMTFGEEKQLPKVKVDIHSTEWLPIVILMFFIIIIGVAPSTLSIMLHETIAWIVAGYGG